MSRIKSTGLINICIFLVVLAGCSSLRSAGNKNDTSNIRTTAVNNRPAQKLDACSLLTQADAESFLGESTGPPATTRTEAMGNVVTQCRYNTPSGEKRVGLLLRQASTADEAAKIFKQARDTSKEFSGVEPQVVEGLGESAYWTGGNLKQLNVLKGDAWLIVTSNPGKGTDPLQASQNVSRKILERTP